jgi:hypothetical protein
MGMGFAASNDLKIREAGLKAVRKRCRTEAYGGTGNIFVFAD